MRLSSWFAGSKAATNGTSHSHIERRGNRGSRQSLFAMVSKKVSGPSLTDMQSAAEKQRQMKMKSPMVLLAERILNETEKMEAYAKLNGISPPSFEANASLDRVCASGEMQKCLQEIYHATRELSILARGPEETVRWTAWGFLDSLSLQIINKYGIAKVVPLDAPISLEALQAKTTLDPVILRRTLRHAMTNRIFQEPLPGFIAHTAASRVLAENQNAQDWVGFNCEEAFPASAHVFQALEASPEATSLTHAGFNYAFGTVEQEPIFATIGKDSSRAKRLGGAMANLTDGEGYQVSHLVSNWDLSDVDRRRGKIVDVGGSHGFVSVDLARKWKNIKFVVQDLPKTIASAPRPICGDETVSSRIEFQAHDFFTEQPVKDADVYFFRWVIHNYSAMYAVAILRNLIPALKPGARVVINEHCLPESGAGKEHPWDEKLMRGMDMMMLALLNAEERDELSFRSLFAAADPRFDFKGVKRFPNCRMGVVEAVWDPDRTGGAQEI